MKPIIGTDLYSILGSLAFTGAAYAVNAYINKIEKEEQLKRRQAEYERQRREEKRLQEEEEDEEESDDEDDDVSPPLTTQDKSNNTNKGQGCNLPSTSTSQAGTKAQGNTQQNRNAGQQPSSSGSQQPQRNNNNNNNNDHNKDKPEDMGKLNIFIKKLKDALVLCEASKELRDKILSFFKNFDRHEENFVRLLEDFSYNNIEIEDILLYVINLFKLDYFENDVSYPNFLALMEIVAIYMKDNLIVKMAKTTASGEKKNLEELREELLMNELDIVIVLTAIMALFDSVKNEILEDNEKEPLEPDFAGIFSKVYHYYKHKNDGKSWTVKEYFDTLRKILKQLRDLDPEYKELKDVRNSRRQIVLEVYSVALQGYFLLVVRAYGVILRICTFFFKKRRNTKAKDGDMKVDGKDRPQKKKEND